MKRDILLCIDLQAYLQTDDLVDENKPYYGTLTLDDDYHAQFVERPCRAYTRRNMRIFDGRYIDRETDTLDSTSKNYNRCICSTATCMPTE